MIYVQYILAPAQRLFFCGKAIPNKGLLVIQVIFPKFLRLKNRKKLRRFLEFLPYSR